MKICEKCRCQNTDTRVFCVDCGATLREKLSDEQEAAYEQQLDENIEKMYNKTDPLHVSVLDKTVGVTALIGGAASLIGALFNPFSAPNGEGFWWALVFFAITALDAFVPQLTWELEKMRLGWYVNGADDLRPGDFYRIGRRVGIVVALLIGIALLVLTHTAS